jgi:hypothetical protein
VCEPAVLSLPTRVFAWSGKAIYVTVKRVETVKCGVTADPFHIMRSEARRTAPRWINRWGVNIFGAGPGSDPTATLGSGPSNGCVTGFVDAAEQAGFPVLLGESTPRFRGTLNSPAFSMRAAKSAPAAGASRPATALCLAASGVDQGSRLVMSECASSLPKSVANGISAMPAPGRVPRSNAATAASARAGSAELQRWCVFAIAHQGGPFSVLAKHASP